MSHHHFYSFVFSEREIKNYFFHYKLYMSLSLSAKCPLLLTNREAQVTFLTIFGPILDSIHRMLIGAVDLACVVGMNV